MEGYVRVNHYGVRWFKNNKRHRTDGPAGVATSGTRWWYQYDKRHRTDGPAGVWAGGYAEWYLNGKPLTREEFNAGQKVWKDL